MRSLIDALRPDCPVFCIRPAVIAAAAASFRKHFPGKVLYAVKCNPHPLVLAALRRGGIRHYDVASLPEIALVKSQHEGSALYFMHPVKRRSSIKEAFDRFGVRHFAVDHGDELDKVIEETGEGLTITVRIETARRADSFYDFSDKFGAGVGEAADLLRTAAGLGCRTGLGFHVGSQCLEPRAFGEALDRAGEVMARAGVRPDCIDVGGGFPASYPGLDAPPLEHFVATIRAGLERIGAGPDVELLAEPGRALVASGCSLLTQVQLRKGDRLFLNDGIFGCLSEQIDCDYRLPTAVFRSNGELSSTLRPFRLFGPTCDAVDALASPWELPEDVGAGDWLEIKAIGAYSIAAASHFNGFAVEAC
ncbi:MAG: type III PLP-dependent enzyme, partial [Geminicoccaceae bacterium]